jgi:DNA-binding NarL/FixJ family response regulator
VLADDSQRMREAVARVLSTKCEVELVGCALDGAQAVDAVLRLQPDILILDIMMPVLDGIRVTRMLRKVASSTRIIFLTGIVDSSFQRAAMEAGGQAYVFKSQLFTDLPCAITAVMTGARFLSSEA